MFCQYINKCVCTRTIQIAILWNIIKIHATSNIALSFKE